MSEKRDSQTLAAYRVDRGKGGFRAIPMTKGEIANRNFFIRLALRDNPSWNLTNEQLERVRVYRIGDTLVLEDENLCTFALREKASRETARE